MTKQARAKRLSMTKQVRAKRIADLNDKFRKNLVTGGRTYMTAGDGKTITVWFHGRSKTTQLGGSIPKVLARLMLAELVREDRGSPTS